MEYKYLFGQAKQKGIDELELLIDYEKEVSIETNNDKLEKFISSELKKYYVKGIIDGKTGKCYTELLSEDTCTDVLETIVMNAKANDSQEKEFIYNDSYKLNEDSLLKEKVDYNRKIDNAFNLYKKLKKYNAKFSNIAVGYAFNDTTIEIYNSHGLEARQQKSLTQTVYEVTVKADDISSNDYDYFVDLPNEELDELKICKKLVDNAIDKLDYKVVQSNQYEVILANRVMANLLHAMVGSFYASNMQQKKSYLGNKLGSTIASKTVTIVEQPDNTKMLGVRFFDDEGVRTYTKDIIKKGVFKTVLYNLKTASKDKTISTGNGYNDDDNTSVRNLYIVPGRKRIDNALKKFNGIYITNIEGLHAGLNVSNGDFSLQAEGYEIVDGQKGKATKLIVISGNFFELLRNVTDVYNDLKFISDEVGSPSIKVSSLDISGK